MNLLHVLLVTGSAEFYQRPLHFTNVNSTDHFL